MQNTALFDPWPPLAIEPTHITQLAAQIGSSKQDGALYLLIDPMLGEPRPLDGGPDAEPPENTPTLQDSRTAAWDGRCITMLTFSEPPLPYAQLPYLVQLQGKEDPLFAESIQIALENNLALLDRGFGGLPVCAWLQSHAGSEELAAWLARMMQQRIKGQTGKRYLRAGDPRTLPLLLALLGEERISLWLGPVSNWYFLSIDGRVTHLQSTGGSQATLTLKPHEAETILDAEAINRTLAQWYATRSAPYAQMFLNARLWVKTAREFGWPQIDDQLAFALYADRYPQFWQHPSMSAIFKNAKETQTPLNTALAEITESQWDQIMLHSPQKENQ
ncbi:MAG: DUF4123 domain-containing protein [Proteobacteria bacterium]|nr:DUF4123 domain-containing protein [Pseudomonadota bacterium]